MVWLGVEIQRSPEQWICESETEISNFQKGVTLDVLPNISDIPNMLDIPDIANIPVIPNII